MNKGHRKHRHSTPLRAAVAALLAAGAAHAQEPAPAPAAPAAPAEPAPAPATTPAPATPAPAEATPAPAPEATAPAPEAVPAEAPKEEEKFTVTTGIGFRAGMRFQNLKSPKYVGPDSGGPMLSADEMDVEARFGGKVTPIIAWTANFTADARTNTTAVGAGYPPPPAGPPVIFEARVMDLVGQLEFLDEFHVWVGRMLTPSDRSNFSGPWFISPWSYPGVYSVPGQGFAYVGPRGTEEIGREVGTTVWGDIGKGKFKYYAAMLDIDDVPANTPLFSGRLQYAFVGDEPGFYGSSTYYGAKDVLAVGVAGQYQKRFGAAPEKVTEFNADILAEFNIGDSGTVTGEGAYYALGKGVDSGLAAKTAYFFLLSYLTPKPIGLGKIQPLFRYQGTADPDMSMIEGGLSYVIKDYFAKIMATFEHTNMGKAAPGTDDRIGNAIRLGLQLQQ